MSVFLVCQHPGAANLLQANLLPFARRRRVSLPHLQQPRRRRLADAPYNGQPTGKHYKCACCVAWCSKRTSCSLVSSTLRPDPRSSFLLHEFSALPCRQPAADCMKASRPRGGGPKSRRHELSNHIIKLWLARATVCGFRRRRDCTAQNRSCSRALAALMDLSHFLHKYQVFCIFARAD